MNRTMLAALAAGALFGAGLALSSMTDRQVVLGFLDVAGRWDPTLAFVMAGALGVTIPAFRVVVSRGAPLFGESFSLPPRDDVDLRLVAGAAVFGIGWGLAGFCPGPVLVGAAAGIRDAWLFVPAMVAGSFLAGRLAR